VQIQEDKPYDEINITPMLDLAYVLLVIFILMTTATVTGLKANLPRASANAPAKPDKDKILKVIIVNNNGSMTMDGQAVTLPDLEQRLKAHKTAHPDFPVVIRGDSATAYQSIVDVVELVTRLGIAKVGLPTKAR
jgi:biopolymer transport protein ExbD